MAARTTLGDHTSTQSAPKIICFTPDAAALRKIVPTLPGSCTRSNTTQSPCIGTLDSFGNAIKLMISAPSVKLVILLNAAVDTKLMGT